MSPSAHLIATDQPEDQSHVHLQDQPYELHDKTRDPAATLVCPLCLNFEFRRVPRRLLDRCFSLIRYKCLRCLYEERRYHFNWLLSIVYFLLIASTVGSGVWFRVHQYAGREKPQDAAAALATARTGAGGQLSPYEQMMLRKPKGNLDNATILKLWRANVGASVIVTMIKTSVPDYDVTADAIIKLKDAEVDPSIILAMIDATYNSPQ
jgi:hypothetical protein